MLAAQDQRRKQPSYTMPFFFEALELTLIWVVFGIFEATLDITQWSIFSYGLAAVWFLYTFYKLQKVLERQTMHKW